jgi:hypothetical protein
MKGTLLNSIDIFKVISESSKVVIEIGYPLIILVIGFIIIIFIIKLIKRTRSLESYEIDCAELGIGDNIVRIKPNYEDMQIAYKIYIELVTRKIGLKIDLENDFIMDIYNSWHEFFRITRELVKLIPANKIKKNKNTRFIVNLAVDVLNEGLRPHLTKWQARFRKWYIINESKNETLDPQDIQKKFPQYELLKSDLEEVNHKLIEYRNMMKKISIAAP